MLISCLRQESKTLESEEPLASKSVRLPNYVFRETDPTAFHIFNQSDEGSEVIHAHCTGNPWEREFPLYDDNLEAMRCAEDIYCAICDRIIVTAKEAA